VVVLRVAGDAHPLGVAAEAGDVGLDLDVPAVARVLEAVERVVVERQADQ
jgi:hypothetical protein